ncbi:hypothetical protein FBU30_003295, partial [Linnemannia zychae]
MSAPNDPEQLLNGLNNRVASLETSLQSLEPALKFFADNLLFFQNISQGLEQRLKHLESSAFDATPSRLRNLERVAESFDKAALVSEIATPLQTSMSEISRTLDDFRRDASKIFATKEDLRNERPPFEVTEKPKSKMAIPEAFSGKREDWNTFADRVELYISANKTNFPTDTDK